MKTTKLTRTLLTGMMTCTMALTAMAVPVFSAPTITQAATTADANTFNVNLHKFKFTSGALIDNDGLPTTEHDDNPRLNDVDFEVWDITELFHQLKKDKGLTNKETQKLIESNWNVNLSGITIDKTTTEKVDTITTTTQNGVDGIASTPLDRRTTVDGKQINSVYLFVEVASKGNVGMISSSPFMFSMSKKLSANKTIDLYVKNHGAEKDLAVNNVQLEEGDHSLEVGTRLDYTVNSPVPAGINNPEEAYTTLKFWDQMTTKGTTLVDFIEFTVQGDEGETFHITPWVEEFGTLIRSTNTTAWETAGYKNAGFELTIDVSQAAKDKMDPDTLTRFNTFLDLIAGKSLTIQYSMIINKDAVPYKNIGNEFFGKFTNKYGDQTTSDDAPQVEIGGHRFIKKDSETGDPLPDAEFVIRNSEGKYAQLITDSYEGEEEDIANGNYHPTEIAWVDEEDATTITSGKGGNLAVYGLEAGTYRLIETKAPTGYEISDKEHPFTVSEAKREGDDDVPGLTELTVLNDPSEGVLPITGGIGIVTFLAIGAAAMGGAVYYKKKKA